MKFLEKLLGDPNAKTIKEMQKTVDKINGLEAACEKLTNEELIKESYKGIRPAPGYPACPDHLEKKTLWELLKVEEEIGVQLTESLAMWPAAAVSGYYFAHPDARYFGLGKIKEDQLLSYSKRRKISLDEARKWLNPNLIED